METFKKTLPKCQGGNTDAGYLFWIMSDDREIPKTAVYGCYDKQARQNQYVGKNICGCVGSWGGGGMVFASEVYMNSEYLDLGG